jgi:prepilin-type N-terminal cleavage/methylation domain-containing protein
MNQPSPHSLRTGFTLIELSIVLVIIGLIVGGIMVGRDLIEAARIRNQVKQLETISSALSTFKLKYNAIPGDFAKNAAAFGLPYQPVVNTGADNGFINDGNGLITMHGTAPEPVVFFRQLVSAGLLPDQPLKGTNATGANCYFYPQSNPPSYYYSMNLNPRMGMIAAMVNGNTHLFLGISECAQLYFIGVSPTGVMTPGQAGAIDQKMDDGVPSTGAIIAHEYTNASNQWINGTPDTTAGKCVTTAAAATYNVGSSTNWCVLLVRLQ